MCVPCRKWTSELGEPVITVESVVCEKTVCLHTMCASCSMSSVLDTAEVTSDGM